MSQSGSSMQPLGIPTSGAQYSGGYQPVQTLGGGATPNAYGNASPGMGYQGTATSGQNPNVNDFMTPPGGGGYGQQTFPGGMQGGMGGGGKSQGGMGMGGQMTSMPFTPGSGGAFGGNSGMGSMGSWGGPMGGYPGAPGQPDSYPGNQNPLMGGGVGINPAGRYGAQDFGPQAPTVGGQAPSYGTGTNPAWMNFMSPQPLMPGMPPNAPGSQTDFSSAAAQYFNQNPSLQSFGGWAPPGQYISGR